MTDPPRDHLASIVEGEARRVAAEARVRPDPARLAEGWERRFVVEARRSREYEALYEAAGFEVLVDPVRADQIEDECGDCRLALVLDYRTLYTRRTRGEAP